MNFPKHSELLGHPENFQHAKFRRVNLERRRKMPFESDDFFAGLDDRAPPRLEDSASSSIKTRVIISGSISYVPLADVHILLF